MDPNRFKDQCNSLGGTQESDNVCSFNTKDRIVEVVNSDSDTEPVMMNVVVEKTLGPLYLKKTKSCPICFEDLRP